MANWCNNIVAFEGSPEAIEQIQQLFKIMAEKELQEDCGQLPDFVKNDGGGYFFAIYQNEGDASIFQYETKWSPNVEVVRQIADHYNIGFTLDYEELGCLVYGITTYTDGILTDTYLEQTDFDTYQFDEDTDSYFFEGETYESDYEILETLLERKLTKSKENEQSCR